MSTDVRELAEALDGVTAFDALHRVAIDHFEARGVVTISYHHLPPPGAVDHDPQVTIATHGIPEDWVRHYRDEKLYEIDPIPRRALRQTKPFRWSSVRESPNLSDRERAILDEIDRAALGDGFAVPVFGPHGRNGYVGLGFDRKPMDLELGEVMELQWAAQLAHQRYCDMLRAERHPPITLSERERQVLEWVVRGKSNSVIAEILEVSPHTVDTYLRRVFVKLGVADRVTAALRGLAIGAVG